MQLEVAQTATNKPKTSITLRGDGSNYTHTQADTSNYTRRALLKPKSASAER